MDSKVYGTEKDVQFRVALDSARRVRVDIQNGVPPAWGDAYSIGWTVWYSYLEIPALEEHHSTTWLTPGSSTVVYSNQPANVDGGPCCKSVAWEFRVKSTAQVIPGNQNAGEGSCMISIPIGVEPMINAVEGAQQELQSISGMSVSDQ